MTSTEPLAHVSPSQDLKCLAARGHSVASVNEIGWCCSDFAGQRVEGTEIWQIRLHHIWGSNIFMQSLQRGHDVHLSINHLEIYSPQPECHSNLQVARRTTIEAAKENMRKWRKSMDVVESWMIRFGFPTQLCIDISIKEHSSVSRVSRRNSG